ncbi:MAG: hybrid sensor histidine kinase/response regulator [Campylobacteraceae bacterium]|nr:hybrid sensor histidine kinase/response regulator [Campylobacteraceae bacterium]
MNRFKILLVDDIEQNLHSLKMIIEDNFDISIFTSTSALDGMAILMKKNIDLILTDIQMPEIDGFDFVEYLRGIEKTKDTPVIFITGIYDKDEYQKRGYNLGAIEYITKPIDDTLLYNKLKVYIDLFEGRKKDKHEILEKNNIIIQQSKMAAMGEMINVISHQLKQPLNDLSHYCQDIKDSFEFEELDNHYMEKFSKNTKQQILFMGKIIDGFTDFFNPKKKKEKFFVKASVDKILELIESKLTSNGISLKVNIKYEKLYGVETEFQQIILNLVNNAQEALIENNIINKQIIISLTQSADTLLLSVEDNAGGVPRTLVNKIFDPYVTTKKDNTGIGLYLVKLIAQTSFNAQLKLENSSNGAKFVIEFPEDTKQSI